MKKYSIFMFGALAMAFASCEDSIDFDAPLQSNPQGVVYEAGVITAEVVGPIAAGSVNLNDSTPNGAIDVLKLTVDSLPADAVVELKFEVANNEGFNGAKTLDVALNNGVGSVNIEALNEAHVALFGKSPKEKDVYYRVPAYVVVNDVEYRWGGLDYFVAQGTYKEVCKDAGFTIEPAYYLVGNLNNWTISDATPFNHSDADVYDDPVFTVVVTVEDNCYWKIVPQSSFEQDSWDGLYGTEVDGDTSLSGTLHEGGQAGCIAEAGKYRFTINMEAMTYDIVPITRPEFLCTPGEANGWNHDASSWLNYYENKGYFCGAVVEKDKFKITDGPSWDTNWGASSEGVLEQNGPDIAVPAEGLYWLVVNTDNLTYQNTPVKSVGIVGGLNSWNADAPIELTANENQSVWSGQVDLSGEWKIIINHSWDSNYGGAIDNLVFDAGNMQAPEDGTYTVTVDFTGHYPTMTLTK